MAKKRNATKKQHKKLNPRRYRQNDFLELLAYLLARNIVSFTVIVSSILLVILFIQIAELNSAASGLANTNNDGSRVIKSQSQYEYQSSDYEVRRCIESDCNNYCLFNSWYCKEHKCKKEACTDKKYKDGLCDVHYVKKYGIGALEETESNSNTKNSSYSNNSEHTAASSYADKYYDDYYDYEDDYEDEDEAWDAAYEAY